jgi:cardiolipin synthase
MSATFTSKIPNILTIGRMVGTVFMVYYYYFATFYKFEILWFVFFLASISDYLDGYISRKFNAVSNFGKCLDPISDKLLLITALIILIDAKLINLLVAFILIGREIIISGLREFLSLQNIELPVSRLAKWKTSFQLFGVGMCFFSNAYYLTSGYLKHFGDFIILAPLTYIIENTEIATNIILVIAVYTTLHTAFSYIRSSAKYLQK